MVVVVGCGVNPILMFSFGPKESKSLDIYPKWHYPTYLYTLVWAKFSLDINFSA